MCIRLDTLMIVGYYLGVGIITILSSIGLAAVVAMIQTAMEEDDDTCK